MIGNLLIKGGEREKIDLLLRMAVAKIKATGLPSYGSHQNPLYC